jgi:hypothetical protein
VGGGFHSNDARGATITVDPATGEPAERVTPLVRAWGAELGVKTGAVTNLDLDVALWGLDIDSELLFIGDAGNTEASRPSRRYGLEVNGLWSISRRVAFDASLGFSHSRFRDDDPAGDRIPGAVEGVMSAGIRYEDPSGLFGALRLRYFGPRPLIEDNSRRSEASTLLLTEMGYHLTSRLNFRLEGLNLLDEAASDIDYWYTSRLDGESEGGIDDFHTHPVEPLTVRGTLTTTLFD